ncbi:MAG: glycosyltransferase family 4 protein [Saprospiraceae bacterium]
MKKKKVVIFGVKYFPSKGGTSRVVENLLWEMKDHFNITIYCYKNEQAADYMEGVKTIQFSETPIKGVGVFMFFFKCFFHLMWNGKYDIVHLHKMDGAFFLPLLNLKFKTVATSHGLPYLNDKWSSGAKFYFRRVEEIFMRSNTKLTSVSKTQVEYFDEKYKRKILHIPNGIHPIEKVQPEFADEILKENKVEGEYLFFAARRLIPLKGCHTLIDALKKIDYQGTLVIAADIEQLPSYTQELKKSAEGIKVKFVGYVSDLKVLNALIARSKFFVFPSELEAMSMMLLEVGSVGTPMICSDIPQNTAVLESGQVLFFESKNADDLAEKINWAFENEDRMNSFAKNAKLVIEEKYLVSRVAEKYIDLYNEVISHG